MIDNWQHNVKNVPHATGVYIMKDAGDKVIYVGKAKDLRSRLRAYANKTDTRFMIPFLASKIETVEFIITETEKEALILENNLIKEHRPRYNVFFRDDKNYYSIRIDLRHNSFPNFQLVRQMKKDGARYFGPYPSSSAAKETLNYLQSIFPLRTCSDRTFNNHSRPCLEYQIKRCLAPCAGLVEKSVYGRMVMDSVAFLEGSKKGLIADLSSRMKSAAKELNFEEAGLLRDRIAALNTTIEKQAIISDMFDDQDVFGLYREGNQTQSLVLHIRKGRVLGKNTLPLVSLETQSEEIISSLITRYYDGNIDIPAEVILPFPLEDSSVIADWLTDKKGEKVSLITPRRGRSYDLLTMANSNAENLFKTEQSGNMNIEATLNQLKEKLSLKKIPRTIECFDISNVAGKYAVGAQVTFIDGRPWKDGYRRYRIKTIGDMDDYGMMREILERRFNRIENLPDLLIVDGGKGQLGIATTIIKDFGIDNVDIIAVAKERRAVQKSAVNRTEDRVYLHLRKEPVYIARFPKLHLFLQQIRDEAHRFAVSYYRRLKEKNDLRSILDEIPGIGKSRKKDLLLRFGDIQAIKDASLEDLQDVEGIGKELSREIYEFLKKV